MRDNSTLRWISGNERNSETAAKEPTTHREGEIKPTNEQRTAERAAYKIFPDWMDILQYYGEREFKAAMMAIKARYDGDEPDLSVFAPPDQAVMRMILLQIDRYNLPSFKRKG